MYFKNKLFLFLIVKFILLSSKIVSAQKTDTDANDKRIKLFLNCNSWECYEDYIKIQLNFFDFVRDRFQADVEIIIISQENGAGGINYTLIFNGRNQFEKQVDTLKFSTKQADSDDMIRENLVNYLKLGLFQYIKQTTWLKQVEINLPNREIEHSVIENDKWNYWVFTLGGNGYGSVQSNQSFLNIGSYLDVNYIKPELKFQNSIYNYNTFNKFTFESIDDSGSSTIKVVNAKNVTFGGNSFLAKSINEHWSYGGYFSLNSSTRENIALQVTSAPALEYNIFPTSQNTERQFRLIIQTGFRTWNLIEENNFDKNKEREPFYRFDAILSLVRSWGNISMQLGGHHFFNRKNAYNIMFNLNNSLRLFEGFNLNLTISSSYIQDQSIYLPKNIVETDVLLGAGILPTNFNINGFIGISYTFGSINNSVVNPRLENAIW
jgi:hypothetical protein